MFMDEVDMPYTSPDDLFVKLSTLLIDWRERKRQYLIANSPPPSVVSVFFGAPNPMREQQIGFITHVVASHHDKININLSFATEVEVQNHIIARRITTAACLFILDEIKNEYYVRDSGGSDLKQLINEALAFRGNSLDAKSEASCLLEAQKFANSFNSFLVVDWDKFKTYLNTKCEVMAEQLRNPYPITNRLMPVFSKLFRNIGRQSGQLIADAMIKSEPLLSDMRFTITASITTNLYFIIRPNKFGLSILLLAPTMAEIITNRICMHTVTLVFENMMKLLGQGIGFSIGMTLDLCVKLLQNTSRLIQHIIDAHRGFASVNGFSLTDGHRIASGIKLNAAPVEDLPPPYQDDYEQVTFEIKPDGMELHMGRGDAAMSAPIRWSEPLSEEFLQEKFAEYEALQSQREFVVLTSAPEMPPEMLLNT